MTTRELLTLALEVGGLIAMIAGATKFIVKPLLKMQEGILKIELLLGRYQADIEDNAQSIKDNMQGIEEVMSIVEEHTTDIKVIKEEIKGMRTLCEDRNRRNHK